MKRYARFSAAMALTAAVVIPQIPAQAHGIWFAQRAKQIAIIYGVGADDLESVKRMPMMENVIAYDADYQPIAASLRVAGPLVIVDTDSPPTLIAAVLQNGTWSKLPDGEFVKKPRDEAPESVLSETTIKYAVTIQGALNKPIPALPNQILQIVPAGTIPDTLGKPLTYRVLFKGKPIGGATLINDMVNDPDAAPVTTAADGTATLVVRNQGLNVIRAVYSSPSDNPAKIDRYEHTATLSFTLPHAPE